MSSKDAEVDKNGKKDNEKETKLEEWVSEPKASFDFGLMGFKMSIGKTSPPKKPDDEPLQ